MSTVRIIAIEDNLADVFLVREALTNAAIPYSLEHYNNGEEAIKAFGAMTQAPDLILLDLNLPRLHGFDVLKAIREHPILGNTKVAVFTSSQAPRDKMQSQQLGANAYLIKPLGYDEFLSVVIGGIRQLLGTAGCGATSDKKHAVSTAGVGNLGWKRPRPCCGPQARVARRVPIAQETARLNRRSSMRRAEFPPTGRTSAPGY